MTDNEKKPALTLLPAILTGATALIAALTTIYINVRNDLKSADTPPAVVAQVQPAPPKPAAPAQPQALRLQLRRIAVQQDGAGVGDADWRFAIEAGGEPLFVFEQESMTSEGGRNIVVVAQDRDAYASLDLAPGQRIPVVIKGWRSGWFKGNEPLVLGEGALAAAGPLAPIAVKATDERKGAFTFYFSAAPEGK